MLVGVGRLAVFVDDFKDGVDAQPLVRVERDALAPDLGLWQVGRVDVAADSRGVRRGPKLGVVVILGLVVDDWEASRQHLSAGIGCG